MKPNKRSFIKSMLWLVALALVIVSIMKIVVIPVGILSILLTAILILLYVMEYEENDVK